MDGDELFVVLDGVWDGVWCGVLFVEGSCGPGDDLVVLWIG